MPAMAGPGAWKTKKPLPYRKRLWWFASPILVGEADRHSSVSCPAPRSHVDKPHDKEGKKDEGKEGEREIHDSIRLNSDYFFRTTHAAGDPFQLNTALSPCCQRLLRNDLTL